MTMILFSWERILLSRKFVIFIDFMIVFVIILLIICLFGVIQGFTSKSFRLRSFDLNIHTLTRLYSFPSKKHSSSSKSPSEVFFCDNCGVEHIKWLGRCSSCHEWNTVKQFRGSSKSSSNNPLDIRTKRHQPVIKQGISQDNDMKKWISEGGSGMIALDSVDVKVATTRSTLFSKELNRVLGGGLVPGSVILLAGEPGIGKSTILIQMAAHMSQANQHNHIVYLSGEETAEQIASRADRLGANMQGIFLTNEVDVDILIDQLSNLPSPPALVIIDSIQTVFTSTCSNTIGSITQIRESAARIVQYAKLTDTCFLMVGHVTKSGDVAGPRVLEHMVDTVLNLEGSEQSEYRLLRTTKNRFGSTSEIGVFIMTSTGMLDVDNPSELFLSSHMMRQAQDGSAVAVILEGTRPLLAEIQCLVGGYIPPHMKSSPKRTIEGYSMQRLLLICAVIEKILHISLYNRDIYVNIVGGLRINEPAADLAVAVTIISSYLNLPIMKNIAFIGEIGLGGELRNCRSIDLRIAEAKNMGFDEIVVPMKKPAIWNKDADDHHQHQEKKMKKESASRGGSYDGDGDVIKVVRECISLKQALNIAFDVDNIDQLIANKRRIKPRSKQTDHYNDGEDDDNDMNY